MKKRCMEQASSICFTSLYTDVQAVPIIPAGKKAFVLEMMEPAEIKPLIWAELRLAIIWS